MSSSARLPRRGATWSAAATCALALLHTAGCASEPAASLRCSEAMRQCMDVPGATVLACNAEVDACNEAVASRRERAAARQEGFEDFKRQKADAR